jgi:predicted Zn-dependent protease
MRFGKFILIRKKSMRMWIWKLMFVMFLVTACDKNDNFVVFGVENDVQLGKQINDAIGKAPSIKILEEADYPDVYAFLNDVRDEILNSGKIAYKDEFAWQIHVIDNDSVQNAFAAPGGELYVYTGMILHLDHADEIAGLLAHEMAHADQRHTVRMLQSKYGLTSLLAVALGNDPTAADEISGQLRGEIAGLKFSTEYESVADLNSVETLAGTDYACNGGASLFIKLESSGSTNPPAFLENHPDPEDRTEKINGKAQGLGCDTGLSNDTRFLHVKAILSRE